MKAQTMRRLRQLHQYVGLFFAPAILFFAFSGLVQTLSVQDGAYGPSPAWVSWMAGIHKHQEPPRPRPAEARPEAQKAKGEKGAHARESGSVTPLKAFVLLLALGLMFSTIVGVLIALNNRAARRPSLLALALGVAVPLALMAV